MVVAGCDPARMETARCAFCHAPLKPRYRVCASCGHTAIPMTAAPSGRASLVVLVALLLAVLVAGYFARTRDDGLTPAPAGTSRS